MQNKLYTKFSNYVNTGHERSIKAKKNILLLFVRKGVSVIISFLLVPLTINYLTPTKYGIWITLSSFISWFYFFDLGLGNGFRNKFAEALANEDKILARKLVSTTYAILSIIVVCLLVLFAIISPFIPWFKVFNTPENYKDEIFSLVIIMFSFFCLQFVTKMISTILTADQRPAIAGYFNTISSALSLLSLYLLSLVTNGSLVYLAITFSFSNFIVVFLATFYFFAKDYAYYKPSVKFVDFAYTKSLMGLGAQFFIIQASVIVTYSLSNMLITQYFSPEYVAPYDIAYKYFSILYTVFLIVITPFWSAITEAYTKKEFGWIKSNMKKLIQLWFVFGGGAIIMLLLSNIVYRLWIGTDIKISFPLSTIMSIYVVLLIWNSIFTTFLNSISKIKFSLLMALIEMIVYIPLTYILIRIFNLGIEGIALSGVVLLFIGAIWTNFQYRLIITNKAKGIWNA